MDRLIPLIVTCGVGADLFSLPLVLATFILSSGMRPVHPNLPFMASWWTVGFATLLFVLEVACDTLLDRRSRLFRRSWPAMQLGLSAVVTTVVVLAMSHGFTDGERVAAIGGGLVTLGIVKVGLIDKMKTALDFFGA